MHGHAQWLGIVVLLASWPGAGAFVTAPVCPLKAGAAATRYSRTLLAPARSKISRLIKACGNQKLNDPRCRIASFRAKRVAAPIVMQAESVDCLVVGGGISGLTTAFYADRNVRVCVCVCVCVRACVCACALASVCV